MGLLRQLLARYFFYALALLLTAASTIVMVRKLTPEEYAYVQGLIKRVFMIGWIPFAMVSWNLYRHVASRAPGSREAYAAILTISTILVGLASLLWSLWLDAPTGVALLSLSSMLLLALWTGAQQYLDALRPIRSAAVVLAYRLVYSGLIVVTVYLLLLGAIGALVAIALSSLLGVLLVMVSIAKGRDGAGPPIGMAIRGLVEAARSGLDTARRIYAGYWRANLLSLLTVLLLNVDIVLAQALSGTEVVAAFLAFLSALGFVPQIIGWGSQAVQRGVLSGEASLERAWRALWANIIIATPLLVLAAAMPLHFVYLLNPRYSPYAVAWSVMSLAILAQIIHLTTTQLALATKKPGEPGERNLVELVFRSRALASTAYIVGLLLALLLAQSPSTKTLAWVAFQLLYYTLATVLIAQSMDKEWKATHVRQTLPSLAKALAASIPPALIISQTAPQPSPHFWQNLPIILEAAVLHLVSSYLILLVLDTRFRHYLLLLAEVIRKRSSNAEAVRTSLSLGNRSTY